MLKKKQKTSVHQEREKIKERVRKHRATFTKEKLEEKRLKDRERYREKKEKGLIKSVKELTKREKNRKRDIWKKNSKRYRQNKALKERTSEFLVNTTPPASPRSEEHEERLNLNEVSHDNYRKTRGRKRVKANRAKVYRELANAERDNKQLRRSVEKYRKRCYRISTPKSSTSPISRVKEITRGLSVPPQVKKKLLLGETLFQQIKVNKEKVKTQQEKHMFAKMMTGKFFRKYKLVSEVRGLVPLRLEKKYSQNSKLTQYERKIRNKATSMIVAKRIKEFLERDENSRMCPGKKDFVVKNKLKKQKRILLGSLKNLHKKFVDEKNGEISYVTFCRLKPFWIVYPKNQDRETCACVKHANMSLIVKKLYFNRCINFVTPDEIIKNIVCNQDFKECMFGACKECKNKKKFEDKVINNNVNMNRPIYFEQWTNIKEERQIKNKQVTIRRTVKKSMFGTVEKLIDLLHSKLTDYKKHVFVMRHQLKELRQRKQSIKADELILHVDFAENYVAKYATEIQAMHFGASKRQISLHTGVYYTSEATKSFCSVSDSLDHKAYAVWAHLNLLLEQISSEISNIRIINFFSDGPSSQYKNKSNIYYLLDIIPSLFPNVQKISWNYSESGHGKGPMDGVGGSLKRSADRKVLEGADITSAADFVKLQDGSSVIIWEVSENDMLKFKNKLLNSIPSIPQIMKLHQITWTRKQPAFIFLRQLSCFSCEFGAACNHQLNSSSLKFKFLKTCILFILETISFVENVICLVAIYFLNHLKIISFHLHQQ